MNLFFLIFFILTKKKKKSSLFLNIRNMRFHQSSPVQSNPKKKIWKNLKKSCFFSKKSENLETKKIPEKNAIFLVFQSCLSVS